MVSQVLLSLGSLLLSSPAYRVMELQALSAMEHRCVTTQRESL